MRVDVKKAIVENIFTVQLYTQEEMEELKKRQQAQLEVQLEAHREDQRRQEASDKVKNQPVRRKNKVGRNEPCPCGSGKKFKQCHGA
jgi:preprotein translocase subunit SecA